ncbi:MULTISPECIES: YerC/YecD family TrpR-related protein [Asticcacaulis]|uniref:YerC/YecD family TrpR-related protein n=1 Tax=Asticcacaulis TaxID=76890 RepID=UPI001AE4CE83|nr:MULTISPECIES: YerC/YecD family TrpR-related protein [Asticcacaulis]MBP2160880.1 TrpR-related protein YerC/YecD [Asticcacaulis solisilvae]MDR6801916.1 TrpR-related protein YerC/YecD [Asticcacaulis sp. BE141]
MRDNAEDRDAVAKAILMLKDVGEVRAFLDDLCTPAELRAFAERFKVARLLDEGQLSYREISERTGASTTTVTRVARFLREMPHQGYRLVLDRMKD